MELNKMTGLNYESIKIGETTTYSRTITDEDIQKFAEVSGDYNPIHLDEEYAKKTRFKGRIAHGILSASFISALIAKTWPGNSIYASQSLFFKHPVRIGDHITAKIEVIAKNDEKHRLTLKTTCENQDGTIVIDGEAIIVIMKI